MKLERIKLKFVVHIQGSKIVGYLSLSEYIAATIMLPYGLDSYTRTTIKTYRDCYMVGIL